jgi:hypothetical protein
LRGLGWRRRFRSRCRCFLYRCGLRCSDCRWHSNSCERRFRFGRNSYWRRRHRNRFRRRPPRVTGFLSRHTDQAFIEQRLKRTRFYTGRGKQLLKFTHGLDAVDQQERGAHARRETERAGLDFREPFLRLDRYIDVTHTLSHQAEVLTEARGIGRRISRSILREHPDNSMLQNA